MIFTPTQDQTKALQEIKEWFDGRSIQENYLTLGGYAGTGKTELIKYLPQSLGLMPTDVVYLAFTGKAVDVMTQRGIDRAMTMHRFIYDTYFDKSTGQYEHKRKSMPVTEKLIIVDEASMVPKELFEELVFELKGNFKVLFVGDHGQLPPVKGTFNLMQIPDLRLEQIHRQAEGNPIIGLSAAVRQGDYSFLDRRQCAITKDIGYSFGHTKKFEKDMIEAFDTRFANHTYIVSRNVDRINYNTITRRAIFGDNPALLEREDKIIFLENDSHQLVFNGMTSFIYDAKKHNDYTWRIWTKDDPGVQKVVNNTAINNAKPVSSHEFVYGLKRKGGKYYGMTKEFFGVNIDYGYCLTCHKAQGSQFDVVFLSVNETDKFIWKENFGRWLYTAITRSRSRVHII